MKYKQFNNHKYETNYSLSIDSINAAFLLKRRYTNPGYAKQQPTTNTDKAIGTWVWAYATSDIEYDWNGTGKSKDALQNCKKDNITVLSTNGVADIDEGSDLCWMAPKTFQTSWELYDSTFKFNSVYYTLQSITSDTLKFSEVFITSTDRITINYTWGKKK